MVIITVFLKDIKSIGEKGGVLQYFLSLAHFWTVVLQRWKCVQTFSIIYRQGRKNSSLTSKSR
jgi:hypothetical protein